MSGMILRRAQLDDKLKQQIRQRVKKLLKQKGTSGQSDSDDESDDSGDTENPEGTVYLFDASDHSRSFIAIEFKTRKEFETYKKQHDMAPGTKVKILEEGKSKGKQDDDNGSKKPSKDDDKGSRKPSKDEEEVQDHGKQDEGSKSESGESDLLHHSHPARIPEGMQRKVAIKDSLIEEFGSEAKDWKVHSLSPTQLTSNVTIKFPEGEEKKYGQLSPDEKARVDRAISEGLAASKGMGDYTSVTPAAFQYNKETNLARYDDTSVEEPKNDSTEPVTSENVGEFSTTLRENGRTLLRKYAKIMSSTSRPMAEHFVDDMANTVTEGVRDGSLSDVSQQDLDAFVGETVKRMLHQEVETRRRSLGDHGVRHVAGNCRSMMSMFQELQSGGIKINGKQKLEGLSIMADHDIGYTVGEAATVAAAGKKHKQFSKDIADQEKDRYDKIFGKEDGDKMRGIIATHDDPIFDWESDPVGSSVRLSDNVSLFGDEKVQDLFLRSPRATELACKLKLAATAKPEDKDLQDGIKNQLHEVVDGGEFEDADKDSLHSSIDEMNEGKFSTTTDILSRFSGDLKGFKFDSDKKMMNVNMQYSSEGQMVDELFGDEVACRQFEKFAKDLGGSPVRGKRGNTIFKTKEGKSVLQLNIDGFGETDDPQTAAMRDFKDKTARTELRQASMLVYPPPSATDKDIEKSKKAVEAGRDKFSKTEWNQIMKAFEEGVSNPDELAKKLGNWPLLKSENDFLKTKTASERISRRLAFRLIADRIAAKEMDLEKAVLGDTTKRISEEMSGSSGHQTQRKDKDLMSDTGGISKNRQKEPEIKPPRTDSHNRYRTKDKTPEQRDPDVDRVTKEASIHPLDCVTKSGFAGIDCPEDNYHRQVWGCLVNIMADVQKVSEKDFAGMEHLATVVDQLIRSPKGEEIIRTFSEGGQRSELCAEVLYYETVMKGKTAGDVSGLRRVSYYVAPGAVEICDRCGAAIRIVAVVEWRDGTKQKYGSECINKILGGDTTLKGLFKKNFNLLRQFQGWLDVLNRPVNQIPKGREYFKSGLYMITDDNGKDIHASKTGAFLFHPDADLERNAVSDYAFLQEGESLPYHTSGKMTYAQFQAKRLKEIEDAKVWLQDQISRLESFLAKVVEKGLIKAEQEGKSVQASGFDSMARSLLARFPQTLREAVQRA